MRLACCQRGDSAGAELRRRVRQLSQNLCPSLVVFLAGLSLHSALLLFSTRGAGMSLAQGVIFVPMWSSSRGAVAPGAGMSSMPPPSSPCAAPIFVPALSSFFPLEITRGSAVPWLAAGWLPAWATCEHQGALGAEDRGQEGPGAACLPPAGVLSTTHGSKS